MPLWGPKRPIMLQSRILAESFPPFLQRVNERVPWPAQEKTALLFMLGGNSISTASPVIRSIYRDIVESDTMLPVETMVRYCPMQNSAHLEERQNNPWILSPKSFFAVRGKLVFLGCMPIYVVLKIRVCCDVTPYRLKNKRRAVTLLEPWIVIKTVLTPSNIIYLMTCLTCFLLVRFKALVTYRKYRDKNFFCGRAPLYSGWYGIHRICPWPPRR